MPVNAGTGVFSVGRDCQIVLIGPFGRVDIPNITKFDCKQETAAIKVDRLDGIQMNAELPKGWNFRIEAERAGPSLDELFSLIEATWYNAGTVTIGQLFQYVQEPDGSSSTFIMDNVSLKLEDPGEWSGDASVKQRLSGNANRRRAL
jgi:hypothetical protein